MTARRNAGQALTDREHLDMTDGELDLVMAFQARAAPAARTRGRDGGAAASAVMAAPGEGRTAMAGGQPGLVTAFRARANPATRRRKRLP